MTEQEVRWEFGKQWIVNEKPDIEPPIMMTILRGFAYKQFKGNPTTQIKIAGLCSIIEHNYQTFLEREGGIERLLQC